MKKYLSLLFAVSCLFGTRGTDRLYEVGYSSWSRDSQRSAINSNMGALKFSNGIDVISSAFNCSIAPTPLAVALHSIVTGGLPQPNRLYARIHSNGTFWTRSERRTLTSDELIAAIDTLSSFHIVVDNRKTWFSKTKGDTYSCGHLYDALSGEYLGELTLKGDIFQTHEIRHGYIQLTALLKGLVTGEILHERPAPRPSLVARICAAFGRGAAD